MCFSVSTNTKKKQKNPYSLIVLVNYYTIRVFATLTYSTRNQWEPVKIRWNLLAGGDFSTLKKHSGLNLL